MLLSALTQSMTTRDVLTKAQDLRNHGDSPHDAKHDYSTMAEDIKVFIAEHGLKNPTLIGHSMCVCIRRHCVGRG